MKVEVGLAEGSGGWDWCLVPGNWNGLLMVSGRVDGEERDLRGESTRRRATRTG